MFVRMSIPVARSIRRLNIILRSLSTRRNTPYIQVESPDALVDDPIELRVSGLDKHQKVTLSAVLTNGGKEFLSCAHYTADVNGHVNTKVQESEGGSFTGLEPMGLFWAMRPAAKHRPETRLVKQDVTTPYKVSISVHPSHVTLMSSSTDGDDILTSTTIRRWYMGRGVRRVVVREGRIRGALFIPAGEGPFPAVLDMFGGSGGLFDFRGALLASRGFLALSLAHFFYDDLPGYEELDYQYYLEATTWLSNHPKATPGGIGTLGVSFGAAIAYMLAAFCPKVRAIVAVNGCPVGVLPDQVIDGEHLKGYMLEFRETEDGYGESTYDIKDDSEILPIWRQGVKVLSLTSGNDLCMDPRQFHTLLARIPPENKRNLEVIDYPGAGHLLEPPYTPLCRESYIAMGINKDAKIGLKFRWGGEVKLHAAAQEDGWRRTLEHFHKYLPHE